MKSLSEFEGKFRFANTVEFEIINQNNELFLQLGGLSPKFRLPLIFQSEFVYKLGHSNTEIRFSPPIDGKIEILYWNDVPNYRPDPEDGPPAPYLFQPQIEITPQKRTEFEILLQKAYITKGFIDYNLPYPKYELLYYLAKEKNAIFHGSPNCNISEFQPFRRTLDSNIHGNVNATYATIDPIWPIFFAILNRTSIKFRIVNGPSKFIFPDGTSQMLYFFAIGSEFLKIHPFTNGMVYIFNRSSFHISGGGEPEEAEWVCEDKIKWFLCLPISPSDFPFIDQIHPHILTKKQKDLQDLHPFIFQQFEQLVELEDGIKLLYPWSDEQLQRIIDYIILKKKFMTWMQFNININPKEGIWLTLSGNSLIKSMVKEILQKYRRDIR
jgi:hypothetical protein